MLRKSGPSNQSRPRANGNPTAHAALEEREQDALGTEPGEPGGRDAGAPPRRARQVTGRGEVQDAGDRADRVAGIGEQVGRGRGAGEVDDALDVGSAAGAE